VARDEALASAIKSYQDKLKANPDSIVFVQLADALRKQEALDAALSTCQSGLTRHPNLVSGLLMMGRIHAARQEHQQAIEVFRKVVQREPNNLVAHALLSQTLVALGRYGEAIAEYQKILALNPDDSSAQQALQAALRQMRRGGATPAPNISETLGSGPARNRDEGSGSGDHEIPAYAAAEEMVRRGLYDEASEVFERILESDPGNDAAKAKLLQISAQRDKLETSLAPPSPDISEALGSGPVPNQSEMLGSGQAPPAESPGVFLKTHVDKISSEEIAQLMGFMEMASARPAATPLPAAAKNKPAEPPPAPNQSADSGSGPAPVAATAPERGRTPSAEGKNIVKILNRLAATEGIQEVFLVTPQGMVGSGPSPAQARIEKVTSLVRMLTDVTKRAAVRMKQGTVRHMLIFGTTGMVLVSPAAPGILAAVAGAGVNLGLLRVALNDCLKRLSEVD